MFRFRSHYVTMGCRSLNILTVVFALMTVICSLESNNSGSQVLQALHCPSCERIHCSPRRALRLQCKGGITTGICGCCPVCAKQAGESCGGAWDNLGKCDEGLVCVYQEHTESKPGAEHKGICKSVLEVLDRDTCRPDCTWEFCQASPNEICSARSVSMEKSECGGFCQHTSCSSCLVLRRPLCPQACAQTDHVCLHRFGRCVRSHMEANKQTVCHQNLKSNNEVFFVCLAPVCPNVAE